MKDRRQEVHMRRRLPKVREIWENWEMVLLFDCDRAKSGGRFFSIGKRPIQRSTIGRNAWRNKSQCTQLGADESNKLRTRRRQKGNAEGIENGVEH